MQWKYWWEASIWQMYSFLAVSSWSTPHLTEGIILISFLVNSLLHQNLIEEWWSQTSNPLPVPLITLSDVVLPFEQVRIDAWKDWNNFLAWSNSCRSLRALTSSERNSVKGTGSVLLFSVKAQLACWLVKWVGQWLVEESWGDTCWLMIKRAIAESEHDGEGRLSANCWSMKVEDTSNFSELDTEGIRFSLYQSPLRHPTPCWL